MNNYTVTSFAHFTIPMMGKQRVCIIYMKAVHNSTFTFIKSVFLHSDYPVQMYTVSLNFQNLNVESHRLMVSAAVTTENVYTFRSSINHCLMDFHA